jgi:threonine/homoserine/homoserine lactone efflux protein
VERPQSEGRAVLFDLGLVWLPLYAYAIDRFVVIMRGARRWLERLSGAALVGLGLRLALERR